jgi:hypothetical protein
MHESLPLLAKRRRVFGYINLPGLEKVRVQFQTNWYTNIHTPDIVTLPCVWQIHLSAPDGGTGYISPILRFLKLPKATSVVVRSPSLRLPNIAILPETFFAKQLPNYAELSSLHIETKMGSGKVTFQSHSRAVFTYQTAELTDYKRELRLWGDLPISSVERVTAIQLNLKRGKEDVWLAGMLGQLEFVDLLELGGDCGHVLRRLRHRIARGLASVEIDTMVVSGGEYARSQAHKFESVKNGKEYTVVEYIPDPGVCEGDMDFEGSDSDLETDLDSDLDSDSDVDSS